MAIITERPTRSQPEKAAAKPDASAGSSGLRWIGGIAALVGIGAAGLFLFPSLFGMGTTDELASASTDKVQKGRLLVTVTEDGNIESASNVDVRCQVAGGGTIIWIIKDGSVVQQGDELVRLDQSAIEDQLNTQKIAYEKAMAAKIQAEEDYSAAEISVREYEQGTYVKELQSAESQIKIAMENLRTAENSQGHTEKMFRKGFVTALQMEADKFAVERAKLDLSAAQTSKKVLVEFTKEKMLKDLMAKRDAADARRRSELAGLELEKDKLDRLQNQLKFSVITAPQPGMVIYANDMGGGRRGGNSQSVPIEEGATIRERQSIIRLPDLNRMQVKVTVHESKVEMIRPGMAARITVLDREWNGKVIAVGNQPEPGNWFSSNIKEYATTVSIEGNTEGLKPGMTAAVEILISDLRDVLTIPVSAVVEHNGKFSAWVRKPKGAEQRPLKLGQSNDRVVEVKDGLAAGDSVILNPRAVVAQARTEAESGEGDLVDRFGGSAPVAGGAPANGGAKAADPAAKDAAPTAGKSADPAAPAKSADASADSPPNEKGKGKGDRSKGGNRRPRMDFAQLDKNSDKKLTVDELPERMQGFIDNIDVNHDGSIDLKEWGEMQKRMQAMRRQQGGEGGPGAGNGPAGAPGGGNP